MMAMQQKVFRNLVILSRALIVFSHADDYIVDFEVRQKGLYFYKNGCDYDIEVQGYFQRRESLAGKRYGLPFMLVFAEVFAAISLLFTVWNIFRLAFIRK